MINDNMLASIIFVPAESHKSALLSVGLCGSSPPLALKFSHGWESSTSILWHGDCQERALVLAWDYKTAAVGCDLLCREINLGPMNCYTYDDVILLGRRAEFKGVGTLILLDTPSAESLTTDRRTGAMSR